MESLKLLRALICCPEYKNDELICSMCETADTAPEKAAEAYSRVCSILFTEGKTLSDYLFFLAVDSGNKIISAWLENKSEKLYSAIKNDLDILSRFAKVSSGELVSEIQSRCGGESLPFPQYEKGNTEISAESVLSYVSLYGSSVFASNKAFSFDGSTISPVSGFDSVKLSDLKNYEAQRKRVIDNTLCFINGAKRQNVLLYGDRGTGKSSTVKALINEYPQLRIIHIPKATILDIYKIYDIVRNNPLRFILFIDDITFSENDEGYSFLKQALEGSVAVMPENCVIYATTNRRRIIKETNSERTGDEMHAADARDENMSLADRFGLYITFTTPDKSGYLDIVSKIAADRKLDISEEKLLSLAERFALKKCGRSPRTARQFVDMVQSRLELGLDLDEI